MRPEKSSAFGRLAAHVNFKEWICHVKPRVPHRPVRRRPASGALPARLRGPGGDFSVLVNGEAVTFTDAAPLLKDGRSFLPMVETFDALGFAQGDITWDAATRSVTAAKDGTSITLTIDQKELTVTRGQEDAAETDTITTDAAPFIDAASSRTYVPVGLVAGALGYNVGWDAQTSTVIIDDVDAILAANSETYAMMERYLEYTQDLTGGTCKVEGSLAVEMELSSLMTGGIQGDYSMLQSDSSAFQFSTELDMELSAPDAEVSAQIDPIDLELRGDLEEGLFYFSSDALTQMSDPSVTGLWFKMDLKSMMDQLSLQTGLDYTDLLLMARAAQDMSFADSLALILREVPLTSASMTTRDLLALYNSMFSDSALEQKGTTYISTTQAEDMDITFTLFTSDSKVTGYSMTMKADQEGAIVSVDASMKGKRAGYDHGDEHARRHRRASGVSIPGFTYTVTMDGTYSASSTQPQTQPPPAPTWWT